MKQIFSIAIVFSFLAVAANAVADEEITANDLYIAFDNNEIGAEAKYKGKKITVTGVVNSIEKKFSGQPVVNLKAGFFQFQFVSCSFPKDAMNQLVLSLQKGDNVKFSCQVDYKILTSLNLSDCALVGFVGRGYP